MHRRDFLAAAGGLTALAACSSAPPREGAPAIGIWDNHCHMGGVPGKTPADRVDYLLTHADRMGVERMSLHLGMTTGVQDPTPEQLRADNDAVLEGVKHAGRRAHGYVYLNPNHLEFSLREFDRCVRGGPMMGVKLWIAK